MKSVMIGMSCLFLTACVTSGSPFAPPMRTVNENVFYSDKNPKIVVEVDPVLTYGGNSTKSYSQSWGDHAAAVTQTIYVFTAADSEKKIERGFAVAFSKIGVGHWVSRCLGKDMRHVKLGGKKYCVSDRPLTGIATFGSFMDYVYANNYEIHPHYFVRRLRLQQNQNTVDFHLIYFEKISEDLYYKLKTYYEGDDHISKNLRATLEKFDDQFTGCFEIAQF